MKIRLWVIEYYGFQSEKHKHDLYGEVMLFPKGTQRRVKVLLLPSFRIVEMIQTATIEEGYTPTDGIKYAYNKWK